MILILSTSEQEVPSCEVAAWIDQLGGSCLRLNGEDLLPGTPYALELSETADGFGITLDGAELRLDDVSVVFYRGRAALKPPSVDGVGDEKLARSLSRFMQSELRQVRDGLHSRFDDCVWLPHPSVAGLNKIGALRAARAVGLEIPATLLTTSRAAALRFIERHGRAVIKSLGAVTLETRRDFYWAYTELVAPGDLAQREALLFPCFLQAYADKQYEIRTFYLDGRCYSMAIFSQLDARTAVDFRRYNWERPNRYVPVRLPEDLEARIRAFMERVGLSTGSLDLIKRPDGRYVFLEVNPVGQFSFFTRYCNYQLEKQIALVLMAKDAEASAGRLRAGLEVADRSRAVCPRQGGRA